jgi:hypothetical protein
MAAGTNIFAQVVSDNFLISLDVSSGDCPIN